MSAVSLPGAYRLTYRDWLGYPDDGRLYELIDGELVVTPPPNIHHQRISGELYVALKMYLRGPKAGEVFHAPVGVKLSDEDVLEPDIVIVLTAHASRIGTQVIEGPPDIVVEILSPGTAKRDLGSKRRLYESSGVAEYWIVDPQSATIEVLVLDGGRYARHGLFSRADRLTSPALPGFDADVGEILPPR